MADTSVGPFVKPDHVGIVKSVYWSYSNHVPDLWLAARERSSEQNIVVEKAPGGRHPGPAPLTTHGVAVLAGKVC